MKRWIRASIIVSCIWIHHAFAQELRGSSFLSLRSTGTDAAYELLEYRQLLDNATERTWDLDITTRIAYQQSFRPNRIAEYFFATDLLTVSGSQIANRGLNDILADYFGLGPQFQSTVFLRPKIHQVTINWSAYAQYKQFSFFFHTPLTWCRTHIHIQETIADGALVTNPFPAQYMDVTSVAPAYTSFTQAIQGTASFGQLKQALQFGRIGCPKDRVKLADFHFAAAWRFYETDWSSIELQLRAVAPHSTKPTALFLLEPVIGNGHHAEIGVGLTGHQIIWQRNETRTVGLYGNIFLSHLFSSTQKRSFDFKINGFGSRYELLKEFNSAGVYTGTLIPAINQTTLDCRVAIDCEFQATGMLSYSGPVYSADIGYNAWIRSKEKICITQQFPSGKFGFKGLQNVTNNITQSKATLNGNNIQDQTAGEFANQAALADTTFPQLIGSNQLEPCSAANPRTFLHKLFAQLSYRYNGHYRLLNDVTLSAGMEAEFEGMHHRCDQKPNKNSVSLWGFWIKGTLEF